MRVSDLGRMRVLTVALPLSLRDPTVCIPLLLWGGHSRSHQDGGAQEGGQGKE